VRAWIAATNLCGVFFTNVTYTDQGPDCNRTRTFNIVVGGLCGLPAETNVVYHYRRDLQGPILTCSSNKTVVCGTPWTFDPPAVTDACGDTNITLSVSTVTNGGCQPVITRTWTATDPCGKSSSCSQSVTLVTAPCLLGWWPGDGNANNLAGGHAGTLHGGVGFTPGEVGLAFNFTGPGQWVEVPDTAALDISGTISVEAWNQPLGGRWKWRDTQQKHGRGARWLLF